MKHGWMVVGGMVAVMATGCAGGRRAQEFQRLQSQVGLLDQRVGQLERIGQFPSQEISAPGLPPTFGAAADAGLTAVPAPARVTSSSVAGATKDRGNAREIQQALKNAGFYQGSVDGKMGPITRESIKEFQRLHGLTDDGVAGRKTWAKLRPYLDGSASGDASAEGAK